MKDLKSAKMVCSEKKIKTSKKELISVKAKPKTMSQDGEKPPNNEMIKVNETMKEKVVAKEE